MGENKKLFLRIKCKLKNMEGMLKLESCSLVVITVSNHLFRQETTMHANVVCKNLMRKKIFQ